MDSVAWGECGEPANIRDLKNIDSFLSFEKRHDNIDHFDRLSLAGRMGSS